MSETIVPAIPEFFARPNYPNALLPAGAYECDECTLQERFVAAFPKSKTRKAIYAGFMLYRSEAAKLGLEVEQWIDGSFVESCLNPEDVDVSNLCDGETVNALSDDLQIAVDNLLNGQLQTKPLYKTHANLIMTYPKGHPRWIQSEQVKDVWRKRWGHTYDRCKKTGKKFTQYPKGYLLMKLIPANGVTPDPGANP